MDWRRRTWVIPVAGVLPLAAIVYAFSLGPSPEKLAQRQRDTGTAAIQAPPVSWTAPLVSPASVSPTTATP